MQLQAVLHHVGVAAHQVGGEIGEDAHLRRLVTRRRIDQRYRRARHGIARQDQSQRATLDVLGDEQVRDVADPQSFCGGDDRALDDVEGQGKMQLETPRRVRRREVPLRRPAVWGAQPEQPVTAEVVRRGGLAVRVEIRR